MLADKGLDSGGFVGTWAPVEAWTGPWAEVSLGLSLGLGLWLAEPEMFGNVGMSSFLELAQARWRACSCCHLGAQAWAWFAARIKLKNLIVEHVIWHLRSLKPKWGFLSILSTAFSIFRKLNQISTSPPLNPKRLIPATYLWLMLTTHRKFQKNTRHCLLK